MGKESCSVSYFWHRILTYLEDRLAAVTVAAWFDQTDAVSLENNKLVLVEPTEFRREIIRQRMLPLILQGAKEEFDLDIEVILREV